MTNYSEEYWQKKIKKYIAEDWSSKPSPFAQLVESYITGKRVLELGTGAGQDGLWFKSKGFDVVLSDGTDDAFGYIKDLGGSDTQLVKFDITKKFPFEDGSFDTVYAQLVIHYFNDETTKHIISEIQRVLGSGGIVALMANSTKDPEYDEALVNKEGLIEVNGITKRFFSKETFASFLGNFEEIIFDEKGRTPKDDAVSNSGMVQFIGRLRS